MMGRSSSSTSTPSASSSLSGWAASFSFAFFTSLIITSSFLVSSTSTYSIRLTSSSSNSTTQIGKTLSFVASVTDEASNPVANVELYPYVNDTQWGAQTLTSADGTATFLIPFPQLGISSLFVSDLAPEGSEQTPFLVGLPFNLSSSSANVSNAIIVDVQWRSFRVNNDGVHLKGMEWEPWFTPLNANWALAEGTPLVGNYDSSNQDVMRQHALWFMDVGIDFLVVDWTNNLWNTASWSERGVYAQQLINTTIETIDCYATMQAEGFPVPKFVILLGLDNGPITPTTALDEEIAFLATYALDPLYSNLFLQYQGGPLLIIFDGGNLHPTLSPAINTSIFTTRWMGSQLQGGGLPSSYWSWMDGSIQPVPAIFDSSTEALTVTNAFFASGGWLYPNAIGQRNGATLLQEFSTAIKYEPLFLVFCQWNEFTGQAAGQGGGPNHDQYYDIYNSTYSNDMEPISLTNAGYRSDHGGWGFLYLNLLKALGTVYDLSISSAAVNFTVLVVSTPENGELVPQGSSIPVEWVSLGGQDFQGWQLTLDGDVVWTSNDPSASSFELTTYGLSTGLHALGLTAIGATTPFPLEDWSQLVDAVWNDPVAVQFNVSFSIV